ncbi:hypothetical protein FA13DRAFT_1101612 [Coprinellus micaceus]|uniref:Uncharacterized protein n=1 Tax=Coprinellus micaceus TaxID=71717 RepID=A0A4Y7SWJ2_COPMI|nr:hypothetical protein FA13DRAFT_1101612 [Coprinellus micaceus]
MRQARALLTISGQFNRNSVGRLGFRPLPLSRSGESAKSANLIREFPDASSSPRRPTLITLQPPVFHAKSGHIVSYPGHGVRLCRSKGLGIIGAFHCLEPLADGLSSIGNIEKLNYEPRQLRIKISAKSATYTRTSRFAFHSVKDSEVIKRGSPLSAPYPRTLIGR